MFLATVKVCDDNIEPQEFPGTHEKVSIRFKTATINGGPHGNMCSTKYVRDDWKNNGWARGSATTYTPNELGSCIWFRPIRGSLKAKFLLKRDWLSKFLNDGPDPLKICKLVVSFSNNPRIRTHWEWCGAKVVSRNDKESENWITLDKVH